MSSPFTGLALNCQVGQYFTYIPVLQVDAFTAPGTCTISPDITSVCPDTAATTFNDITGVLISNKPQLPSNNGNIPEVYTITVQTASGPYTFQYSYEIIPAQINNFFLNTNEVAAFTPFYNAIKPSDGSFDFSYNLVTGDYTGGLYPYPYTTNLPTGLIYDESTGAFSGQLTFFSIWPLTNYEMRVQNILQGTSYSYFGVAVDNKPTFAYPESPYIYQEGDIVTITPVIIGQSIAVIYSVAPESPGLPANLTINRSTGVISGIIAANAISNLVYTIVAQTSSGSISGRATATLIIEVNKLPDFIYPDSPYQLPQGIYAEIVPVSQSAVPNPAIGLTNFWTAGPIYPFNFTNLPAGFPNNYYPSIQNLYTSIVKTNNGKAVMYGNFSSQDTFIFDTSTLNWTLLPYISPATNPPAITNANMVYNSLTNQVLLFGGTGSPDFLPIEWWLFDMQTSKWTNKTVPSAYHPEPRINAAMTYDSVNNKAILFSGLTSDNLGMEVLVSNDVDIYDFVTNTWSPTSYGGIKPSNRMLASFFNTGLDSCVLFGGQDESGTSFYNDVWVFQYGIGWTYPFLNSISQPEPRSGASFIYKSNFGLFYMYGGVNAAGIYLNDLWVLNVNIFISDWQQISANLTPSSPNTSYSLPLISTGLNEFILFRNDGLYNESGTKIKLAINPPQDILIFPYQNFPYAYNDTAQEFLYIPFYTDDSLPTIVTSMQTWIFSVITKVWTRVITVYNPPDVFGSKVVFDSVAQVYYLFAGYNKTPYNPNTVKVYKLQGGNWQLVTTFGSSKPLVREGASAAFDPVSRKIVYFGGNQVNIAYNETWIYDTVGSSWTPVTPTFALSPSNRYDASMVYNTSSRLFVLFGGQSDFPYVYNNETWTFNLLTNTWEQLLFSGEQPSPRVSAYMIYDSAINKIILWSGHDDLLVSLYLNDTWELNIAYNGTLTAWTNLQASLASLSQDIYSQYMMGYNATQDKVYLIQAYPFTNVNTLTLAPLIQPSQASFGITYSTCVVDRKYTATPSLPYGLVLNSFTGVIYGTPTVLQPPRLYLITEINSIGTFVASLIISVLRPYTGGRDFGDCYSATPDYLMRHKATVLQHVNTQRQLTKKQQWSQIAKNVGRFSRRTWATQSVNYTNPNNLGLTQVGDNLVCPSNPTVCIPTSSSDVPGPIMRLCYNPSQPPLNFNTRRQYTLNGTKYPQRTWAVGDKGFPVGKAGSVDNFP